MSVSVVDCRLVTDLHYLATSCDMPCLQWPQWNSFTLH